MKILIPVDYVKSPKEAKQPLTEEVKQSLLNKAKELLALSEVPMRYKEMMNKLEKYYVNEGKHYTNKELKDICEALYIDLNTCKKCGKYPCECNKPKIEEIKIKGV